MRRPRNDAPSNPKECFCLLLASDRIHNILLSNDDENPSSARNGASEGEDQNIRMHSEVGMNEVGWNQFVRTQSDDAPSLLWREGWMMDGGRDGWMAVHSKRKAERILLLHSFIIASSCSTGTYCTLRLVVGCFL